MQLYIHLKIKKSPCSFSVIYNSALKIFFSVKCKGFACIHYICFLVTSYKKAHYLLLLQLLNECVVLA